ncbi:unnamed protein product [Symbiodinium natans]|uniref:Uncharacterized protein n=1 Tax=Symbiodinium natans TaxID=878477 RepID=A0A812L9V2_9DINO|nr:unnamed protein product [Symbiodinium natans]
MCQAKPGHEALGGSCGLLQEEGSCNMQFVCRWVLPTILPGHCEGKASQPHHKMLCDGLKYDKFVCESQTLFCDWIPEKKVYGNAGSTVSSGSSGPGGDGMCKAKPGHEAHGRTCGFLKEQNSCDLQFICQWTLPRVIRAHCEGKSSQPHHKMLCDGLKYDKFVCESQTLFCDWIPEQKVYD